MSQESFDVHNDEKSNTALKATIHHAETFLLDVNSSSKNVVEMPTDTDILCGRGKRVNYHKGNTLYRGIVRKYKNEYLSESSSKKLKSLITGTIVKEVRSLDPPGRFLEPCGDSNGWVEIGDVRAMKKTAQALREYAKTKNVNCTNNISRGHPFTKRQDYLNLPKTQEPKKSRFKSDCRVGTNRFGLHLKHVKESFTSEEPKDEIEKESEETNCDQQSSINQTNISRKNLMTSKLDGNIVVTTFCDSQTKLNDELSTFKECNVQGNVLVEDEIDLSLLAMFSSQLEKVKRLALSAGKKRKIEDCLHEQYQGRKESKILNGHRSGHTYILKKKRNRIARIGETEISDIFHIFKQSSGSSNTFCNSAA